METFLLLHAFSPMTATIIIFSNHYTKANTFQNSTVTKGRAQARGRQKGIRKQWSNTSLHDRQWGQWPGTMMLQAV